MTKSREFIPVWVQFLPLSASVSSFCLSSLGAAFPSLAQNLLLFSSLLFFFFYFICVEILLALSRGSLEKELAPACELLHTLPAQLCQM